MAWRTYAEYARAWSVRCAARGAGVTWSHAHHRVFHSIPLHAPTPRTQGAEVHPRSAEPSGDVPRGDVPMGDGDIPSTPVDDSGPIPQTPSTSQAATSHVPRSLAVQYLAVQLPPPPPAHLPPPQASPVARSAETAETAETAEATGPVELRCLPVACVALGSPVGCFVALRGAKLGSHFDL